MKNYGRKVIIDYASPFHKIIGSRLFFQLKSSIRGTHQRAVE